MKIANKGIYCIAILTIAHVGLLCAELVAETNEKFRQNLLSGMPDDGGGKILSRKRRFLSFPEGSSFQVVYDQTIPIVGNTLLFTVGVTVAAAYQLPNVSPFEVLRMLQEKIAGGSLLRRTDENVNSTTLIDTSTSNYDKYNKDSYYYSAQSNQSYYGGTSGSKNILNYYNDDPPQHQSPPGGVNRINYYTNENPNIFDGNNKYKTKWSPPSDSNALYDNFPPSFVFPLNSTQNDWGSIVNRYVQAWIRKYPPNFPMTKKRYYPVFGKRSIDEHTHPEDKYFLEHHRATRHQLYRKIETFLDGRGKHGHHCVLRALCESGQRRNQKKPESFLREILKAVFSIPTTHELPVDYTHRTYDEAHAHTGDCEKRYPFCKDSIWSDEFVF
ncbi:uncharacterized protein LOC129731265 [Wyeomyia smithii]|uniref:uncharacterized protein LOC129731265 n=1 Tax=Wyeomyia smithii TaxID=174621 RepID=UPI002467AFD8|nr:uncharacterized protein LOC129731265 [Wyeomyia smithii]